MVSSRIVIVPSKKGPDDRQVPVDRFEIDGPIDPTLCLPPFRVKLIFPCRQINKTAAPQRSDRLYHTTTSSYERL